MRSGRLHFKNNSLLSTFAFAKHLRRLMRMRMSMQIFISYTNANISDIPKLNSEKTPVIYTIHLSHLLATSTSLPISFRLRATPCSNRFCSLWFCNMASKSDPRLRKTDSSSLSGILSRLCLKTIFSYVNHNLN